MASPVGDHSPNDAASEQSKISNKVEHFVADEFVLETQWPVEDRIVGKNDAAFHGRPTNQALVLHRLFLMLEAEGASGGNFAAELAIAQLDFKSFAADQRMREVDRVRNAIARPWVHSDELVTFMKLDFAAN